MSKATNSVTLSRLDADQFTSLDQFFRSDAAAQISSDFYNYLYTSACEYLETGDAAIVNRAMGAARIMHRVRLTAKLVKVFSCHNITKTGKLSGKMSTARRDKILADLDGLKSRMEAMIANDNETKASKAANPFTVETGFKQLDTILSKLADAGASPEEINAHVSGLLAA